MRWALASDRVMQQEDVGDHHQRVHDLHDIAEEAGQVVPPVRLPSRIILPPNHMMSTQAAYIVS